MRCLQSVLQLFHCNLLLFFNRKVLLLFIGIAVSTFCFAQQTVSGRVTDSTSNQGLANISVVVKGTTRGTATNANGEFRIAAAEGEVLVISAVNYLPYELTVGSSSVLGTVILVSSNPQLNEFASLRPRGETSGV